jgi:hypothetical protein
MAGDPSPWDTQVPPSMTSFPPPRSYRSAADEPSRVSISPFLTRSEPPPSTITPPELASLVRMRASFSSTGVPASYANTPLAPRAAVVTVAVSIVTAPPSRISTPAFAPWKLPASPEPEAPPVLPTVMSLRVNRYRALDPEGVFGVPGRDVITAPRVFVDLVGVGAAVDRPRSARTEGGVPPIAHCPRRRAPRRDRQSPGRAVGT